MLGIIIHFIPSQAPLIFLLTLLLGFLGGLVPVKGQSEPDLLELEQIFAM